MPRTATRKPAAAVRRAAARPPVAAAASTALLDAPVFGEPVFEESDGEMLRVVAEPEVRPPGLMTHYYHAWLPNLQYRKGRSDQLIFRGAVIDVEIGSEKEAKVRECLSRYVPGGNPDRWKGDTTFDENGFPVYETCRECGLFVANHNVFVDHLKKTDHMNYFD